MPDAREYCYYRKAEAAKGINMINHRFQDSAFQKKAVATYGDVSDSFGIKCTRMYVK